MNGVDHLPPRSLPLTLALAQLRHRRTQNISTILGVAVGVMVLITALSLTNGFVRTLIDSTLRAVPQLTLTLWTPGERDPELERRLARDPDVVAFAPFGGDKGLLIRPATEGRSAGTDFVELVGVTRAQADVLNLREEERDLLRTLRPGQIVPGAYLSQSVGVFDRDTVRFLNSQQRRTSFEVKGLFRTGNFLIDSRYAFVHLDTLEELQGSGAVLGYQVRVRDPELAPVVGQRLAAGQEVAAVPWQDLNRELLNSLALQKQVIGIVVFLIVIVASLGIANVLTLTVFEKTPDIAILRAVGATRRDIQQAFVIAGLLLGAGGLLLGNLLGLALSLYFQLRPFPLPGDLFFISTLPVELRAIDFLWVNGVSLVTTLLAALLPARRAAGIEPARVIR